MKKKIGHSINLLAMFLLAVATWRFHGVINKIIDRLLFRYGITDPLITDITALVLLLIVIALIFTFAGISLKKIIDEFMGK